MKKAEIVADQIEQTIVGQRWEPGDLLGSEMELIARYGVSRAVFRGAVRLPRPGGPADRNPALHLFVRTLTDLTRRQQPVLDRNRLSPDDIHAAHAKIAEAIIARDGALARRRMMTRLEEVSATGPRRPPARLQRGEAHPAAGGEVLREEPAESVVSSRAPSSAVRWQNVSSIPIRPKPREPVR